MELSEKKIQILEVAEKLFAQNGFKGTSVRTIAKAADINIAMISYYFGSKENLLKELSLYRMSDYRQELKAVLAGDSDYLQKVDALIKFTIKRLHRNRRIHKIINFEYAKNSHQIDFKDFIEQKKQNYQLVEEFVKEGQNAGVFSKKTNIPLIVPTIYGSYFNLYYNKNFFQAMHNMPDEITMDIFVENDLVPHIQRTIKALLTYED